MLILYQPRKLWSSENFLHHLLFEEMSHHWHHMIIYRFFWCMCIYRDNIHVPFWTCACSQFSTFLKVGTAIPRQLSWATWTVQIFALRCTRISHHGNMKCVIISSQNHPKTSQVKDKEQHHLHFLGTGRWWEYKDGHAHHSSRIKSSHTLISTRRPCWDQTSLKIFFCWLKHKQQLLQPINAILGRNLNLWRQRDYHAPVPKFPRIWKSHWF